MSLLNGLTLRLFLSHAALVVLVLLGVGVWSTRETERAYLTSLQRGLEDEAVILAVSIAPALASGSVDQVLPFLAVFDDRTSVRGLAVDRQGFLVAGTEPEYAPFIGERVSAEGIEEALRGETRSAVLPGSVDLVYVATPVFYDGQLIGAVRVSYTIVELRDQLDQITAALLLTMIGGILVSIVASLTLAYGLAAPARRLAAAANALASGDLHRRSRVTGRDEIARAAQAFDQMADRLLEMHQAREALLSAVSHEIHSTITGISMATELLQRDAELDLEARRLLLRGLGTHVQRLKRLADDLLEGARLARGSLALQVAEVDVEDLVAETVAGFAAAAIEHGVRLHFQVHGPLPPLRIDQERIGQSLGNLIENALRHTPAGGEVLVEARVQQDQCLLLVRDQGPGMPPELAGPGGSAAPPAPADDRTSRGRLGLGLTIARSLVEAHGGRLSIASVPGGGTTCSISLPLMLQQPAPR